MKIIHTSDWHLGQILYGYDRTEEHTDFFRQLKEIAVDENPDAMLVSGDIFDVSSPSTACMRMFTDFLLELQEAIPGMTLVVTSGNHDSASRIDVNRNLWRRAGIHVVGNVKRVDGRYDFSENIIEIPGKGRIVAVPYVNRSFMAPKSGDYTQEQIFFDEAANQVKELPGGRLPVVLMAHLTVEGCDMACHRTATVGNINTVESSIFNEVYDYVALGHIHRPQNIGKGGRIRYSGTPVATGFDENFDHSVSIVEIRKPENGTREGSEVEIRERIIKPFRKLLTYPENPLEFKKAIKALAKLPAADNSYIRLNVAQEEDLPADCQERAAAAVADMNCRFCLIKYTRITGESAEHYSQALSTAEFSQLLPKEIASDFFKASGVGEDRSRMYMEMIDELIDDLNTLRTM